MSRQVVLMTGCSMGIGLAIAKRLAQDPDHRFLVVATVIAMSEKADLVEAVGNALDKTVFIKELDITNDKNITTVVDDVIKDHGRIDVLLNVAGMGISGVPEHVTRKKMIELFDVNVFGTFRLTQTVLPHMKQRKAGKIITFSSSGGRNAVPYLDFYCASKFAIEGFFESLAASVRAFNIRVCLIEPGAVGTALFEVIKSGMETASKDETVHDIDRGQLTNFLGVLGQINPVATEEVADAVMSRCLDVEVPDFRHMLDEETKNTFVRTATDLTGQAAVEEISKMFGC